MKKVTLLFFALVLCVSAALWYFGHPRNTTEEPIKIYKATPLPQIENVEETSTSTRTGLEHTTGAEVSRVGPEESNVPSTPPDINTVSSESTETLSEDTNSSHFEADTPARGEPETNPEHTDAAGETSHEHTRSRALKAEYEAIRSEGNEMAKAGNRIIVSQLNQMSLDEQVVTLKKMKEAVFQTLHPLTQEPLYQTPSEAEAAWQFVLNGLVDADYTPPAGFE